METKIYVSNCYTKLIVHMHRTKTFSFVHLDSFIVYSTIFAFISIQYEERRKEKEG